MKINYRWAINHALDEEMAADDSVIIIGEDVAKPGGPFGITRGLLDKYGPDRVRDTPISEEAIVGLGIGAAITGLRPVVEIMFMDFLPLAMDQVINHAAKFRYTYNGQVSVPMVIRTLAGAGFRAGVHHSQSLEAMFAQVPGLKVVMPSGPADAKGLLKAAIRDNNPVLFMEHKNLLSMKEEVPEGEHIVPLGVADIKRPGEDVTVVATGAMVHLALAAAEELAGEGIEVEVLDPRTILPLDRQAIIDSVKKTSRLVIVHEAPAFLGFGAEVAALVAEECIYYLDSPVKRVTSDFVPIPVGRSEDLILPSKERIIAAVRAVLRGE